MLAGVTQPLAAAARTPIGPVATSIGNAIGRTARSFNSAGKIRVVNFPGGGAARITGADIKGPNGARARVFGGSGVTYYWPIWRAAHRRQYRDGRRRPSERPSDASPAACRRADERRRRHRALHRGRTAAGAGADPLRARAGRVDRAQHRGAARRAVPERAGAGRCGCRSRAGSAPAAASPSAPSCAVVSFNYLQMSTLQLGPTRLPVCPIGPAMVYKREGGPVIASARLNSPVLNGRLGKLAAPPRRRRTARSPASNSPSTASRCGSASRNRRSCSMRRG